MRFTLVAVLILSLSLLGCEDDPIIGPSDEDTGGGSYGNVHFSLPALPRHAPLESTPDSTATDTSAASPAAPRTTHSVNPYRF